MILAAVAAGEFAVHAEKVKIEQTPAPVQEAIRSRSGRQPVEDIDRDVRNGQATYEASWKNREGAQQELLVSEQGSILRDVAGKGRSNGLSGQNLTLNNKTAMNLNETPQAVQVAISNRLLNAPMDSIQRGMWNGQTVYEIAYRQRGQLKTYQVLETGMPVMGQQQPNAIAFQPRYGTADANVPLSNGAKLNFKEAPETVQRTVTNLVNGAQIEDFERGQWNGRTVYQAAFKHNGQNTELQVFEDGTVVTKSPAGSSVASSSLPASSGIQQHSRTAVSSQNQWGVPEYNLPLQNSVKLNLKDAPVAVQRTVTALANGALIEDFERGQWNGRPVYEATFKRNGQTADLQVFEDGIAVTQNTRTGKIAVGAPAQGATGTAPR